MFFVMIVLSWEKTQISVQWTNLCRKAKLRVLWWIIPKGSNTLCDTNNRMILYKHNTTTRFYQTISKIRLESVFWNVVEITLRPQWDLWRWRRLRVWGLNLTSNPCRCVPDYEIGTAVPHIWQSTWLREKSLLLELANSICRLIIRFGSRRGPRPVTKWMLFIYWASCRFFA